MGIYKRLGMLIVLMLFMAFNFIGCGLYVASEQHRKIDSKAGRQELPKEAYDMEHVEAQKRKDLLRSYKLNKGLEALKDLAIVKDVSIKNNKIRINFLIKDMEKESKDTKLKEKIIWENALYLCHTIYDTFPEIEEIRLSSEYYFFDQYGHPYKEEVFIATTNRNQLKRINRDYFQPEMLSQVVDFYMSDYVTEKITDAEK